jgi:hypothetical protein
VPVATGTGGDLLGGDLQSREQGGGAVPDVVVGEPFGQLRSDRRHRGGPVRRLDLIHLVGRRPPRRSPAGPDPVRLCRGPSLEAPGSWRT